MLSIKNISKSFKQRGTVLDNLCLEVEAGETISIMGPSGSGKTTLMNIIGLLDKPDSGDIFFKGGSIANFSESHQNIFLPMLATKHSKIRLSDKKLYINELMIRAGIYDLKNKYPSQISGGEAQRVALVRALVNKPSILLADEPTGSLDAKNAESMGELLLEMNKEYSMTLILATHSIDIANKMSKKLHLVDGKLISE